MEWFYVENEEQFGPVSREALQALLQSGAVARDTLVWHAGLPDWSVASHHFPLNGEVVAHQEKGTEPCANCHQQRPATTMATLQGQRICLHCMPQIVQRLQEGMGITSPVIDCGVWREGKYVLARRGVQFPPRCVHCNQPAKTMLHRRLTWHSPAYFLVLLLNVVIYVIVALCVQRKSEVHIALCADHLASRKRFIIAAWIGALISLVATVVGLAGDMLPLGFTGLFALPGILVICAVKLRLLVPVRIELDGTVKLRRLSNAFMDSLPGSPS